MLLICCSIPALLILASRSGGPAHVPYYVRFIGSVAGLDIGSPVLFGGIPVGRVTDVQVDPQNSSLARVDLSIDANAAIYDDTKAVMTWQLLSGKIVIDITRGGQQHGRQLQPGEEIPARYSALGKVVASLPSIEASARDLLDRVSTFVSDEDIALSNRIFDNVEKLRGRVATEAPVITAIAAEASNAVAQMTKAWEDFQQAGRALGPLATEANATEREIGNLATTASHAGADLGQFVVDNRRQIEDFASNGLSQVPPLLADLHRLGRTLDRLWNEIRQDPARFFLTSPTQEGFEPPPMGSNQHR